MGEATADWTALQLALDLRRDPWGVRRVRQRPLPPGMALLLTVAAGEAAVEAAAVARLGRPIEAIRDAATFFIEQILLAPGTDSYRVLGTDPGAATAELRHNMALLMRWLHPDVAREGDPAMLAQRISAAWNTLKTPEKRAAYDRERGADPAMPAAGTDFEAMWAKAEARRARRSEGDGKGMLYRRKSRLPRLLGYWLLGRPR